MKSLEYSSREWNLTAAALSQGEAPHTSCCNLGRNSYWDMTADPTSYSNFEDASTKQLDIKLEVDFKRKIFKGVITFAIEIHQDTSILVSQLKGGLLVWTNCLGTRHTWSSYIERGSCGIRRKIGVYSRWCTPCIWITPHSLSSRLIS